MIPEFFNDYEPVNKPFDPNTPEAALVRWAGVWFWRRRRPRISGTVISGNSLVKPGTETHSAIFVDLSTAAFDVDVLKSFFSVIDLAFGLDFGFIHPMAPPDLSDLEYYRTHTMPFGGGFSTHTLRRGLPDLPWAAYFGPPYLKLFGDGLGSAPAYRVEVISEGFYVQLTKDFKDPEKEPEKFEQVKRVCKRHLGSDAFVGDDGQSAQRVPEFLFTGPENKPQAALPPHGRVT